MSMIICNEKINVKSHSLWCCSNNTMFRNSSSLLLLRLSKVFSLFLRDMFRNNKIVHKNTVLISLSLVFERFVTINFVAFKKSQIIL